MQVLVVAVVAVMPARLLLLLQLRGLLQVGRGQAAVQAVAPVLEHASHVVAVGQKVGHRQLQWRRRRCGK